MNRQDLFMANIVSVDCSGNEPDQSGRPGGFEAELIFMLGFLRSSPGKQRRCGKLQSEVVQKCR